MYTFLRTLCKEKGIQLIHGLVKSKGNNSLKYWLQLGYEEGEKCIWVEDWLVE
jgi:hypothetical protein